MSTLRGLRFCDKCDKSIIRGEVHFSYGKSHYCGVCEKKRFSLTRVLVACLVMLSLAGGYMRDKYTHIRIDTNKQDIKKVSEYAVYLDHNTRRIFDSILGWTINVEQRLALVDLKYAEETSTLKDILEQTKKEIQSVLDTQKNLVTNLKNKKITKEESSSVIIQLKHRIDSLESKLQHLSYSPDVLVRKILKPTVGVGVHDTNGQRTRGSGVLFKREQDEKSKEYRYYGMTAYHVWGEIFAYQQRAKDGLLENAEGESIDVDNFRPYLVIYVYNGRTTSQEEIIKATWIHPTMVVVGRVSPLRDFAVFTFTSPKKFEVAELSTDAEIREFKNYGVPMITTGISPASAPAMWTGHVANPNVRRNSGVMCHTFGYYGQSGGPTFDARTLKLVGINQRIHIHPLGFGPITVPDTNVLYITTIDIYRVIFRTEAGKQYKRLLD